ncbi:hypothetical protein [Candidatus Nitrospira bockiana]
MKQVFALLGLLLILSGCQTAKPTAAVGAMDNSGFMSLWKTYRQCQAGTDFETMRLYAVQLETIAHQPRAMLDPDIPLPRVIRRWVSEPANRLAVDPKAMAAACTIRAGHVALSAGRWDVADEMFRAVLKYPEPGYSYYVTQARGGLAQITVEARLSGVPLSEQLAALPILAPSP